MSTQRSKIQNFQNVYKEMLNLSIIRDMQLTQRENTLQLEKVVSSNTAGTDIPGEA